MNQPTLHRPAREPGRARAMGSVRARRSVDAIKDALDTKFLLFSHVTDLLADLQRTYDSGKRRATPRHLVILGPSGVGKSSLLSHFLQENPRVDIEDRTLVPVVLAQMPATPTQRRILEALVTAMDPELPAKGSVDILKKQVRKLFDACGVVLVIMDESSHMVDRGQERTHYLVGDALKQVVDFLGRPFVLAGIPRLKRLLEVNEQLRRRFSRCRTMEPFCLADASSATDFRSAVFGFASELEGIETVDLAGEGVLPSLFFATNGLLKPLVDLLKDAVELAMCQASPTITMKTLSSAFVSAVWHDAPATRNPFHEKFDGFPLINPGEPYAPPERR